MIQLYTCRTANGYRASIMLEESGLPYTVHALDLAKREQKTPAFLAINAIGRLPALVDDGFALSESLAIVMYVAEKSGRLLPQGATAKALAWQWCATVASGFSAAAAGIFFARLLDEAAHQKLIAKFRDDLDLYLGAMERRLERSPYLAGDAPTFADVMAIPTILASLPAMQVKLDGHPAIARWSAEIGARPAVVRGMAVPS